ncbi:hypothetical protein F5X99DRAFT_427083 [Biscogniauxia marginata]|nr:hypothetical protein F5X99DRAFT_427083 [Biscogniauxia marginata]
MCFRRTLHFSVHDTRSFMAVEPFSLKDDAVFVNPSLVVPHHCEVKLPPPLGESLIVGADFFDTDVIVNCFDHTCCVIRIIDQKCARCIEDMEVFDCELFTKSHEYIPYESVMDRPELETAMTSPGTPIRPIWTADIEAYPHQFYSGHPFNKRQDIDGEAIHAPRVLFFALAGDIYTQRNKLALWLEQERNILKNEALKTPEGIKQMSGPGLHWKLDEVHLSVRAAQQLLQMANEVSSLANEMSKKPSSLIKSSLLWQPSPEGPLAEGLDYIVKSWEGVVEIWARLNSAGAESTA